MTMPIRGRSLSQPASIFLANKIYCHSPGECVDRQFFSGHLSVFDFISLILISPGN